MFSKILWISSLLQRLRNSNLKYRVAKKMWKKLVFTSTNPVKESRKFFKTHLINVYLESKILILIFLKDQISKHTKFLQVKGKSLLHQKSLEKLLCPSTMLEFQRLNYLRKIFMAFLLQMFIFTKMIYWREKYCNNAWIWQEIV